MRRILTGILLIISSFVAVFPQAKKEKVTQMPDIEPFKINRGSSFSASTSSQNSQASNGRQQKITQDFNEALDVIRKNHVNGNRLDYNELAKSSIVSMLRALDPHSNYFDSDEYQELLTDQQSEYFGIGATIANYYKNNLQQTFVISTFPDSPAFRAGLRFGDKILAVNRENMSGKDSGYVRDKVRGKRGTIVSLTIERADTKKIENIEIVRNRVPQPSIPDAYLLRQGIAYIDLSNGFNYTTSDELDAALKELRQQGMTSLILDLRNNPGGILDQAVKVAEKFLPYGSIVVTQRGRFRIDNRVWKSTARTTENVSLVVLTNEGSASASEIVAGALQDYDRALIIGENTFGKGLVQSIINLPYGSGLTLTTAKYYTPSGRSIQRDYSKAGLYDYYQHKIKIDDKDKIPSKTLTGRTVYSGDGITPDILVKTPQLNKTEISLLDPLFFFSGELANGRVKGFENSKITKPVRYGLRVRSTEFIVSDELLAVFKTYVLNEKGWNISAEEIDAEKQFIKSRLRYYLANAAHGNVAASQVLIEEDPQVASAVEALPRAQQLALSATKTFQKLNK